MVKSNENAIQEAAYYNWQNAGCPMGQDEYFWTMAIEQVSGCKSSCASKSNASAAKKSPSKTSTSSTKAAACKSSTSSKKSK